MEKFNESRLRGDYHEYVTVEEIGRRCNVPVESYDEIYERSKKLPPDVRAALENAGSQCTNLILVRIKKDYPGYEIVRAMSVGKLLTGKRNDDVTDIEIVLRESTLEKKIGVSLKFTESRTGSMTKNPGIGTIFKDYFSSPNEQESLDKYTENERAIFLKRVIEQSGMKPERNNLEYLMKMSQKMPEKYRVFRTNPFAQSIRLGLTSKLRDKMYDLLLNVNKSKIVSGCKLILGADSKTDYMIISRWCSGKVSSKLEDVPRLSENFDIVKNADNSVFVIFDSVAFRLECQIRVKHMGSRVWDSIKLCGSKEIRLESGKKI